VVELYENQFKSWNALTEVLDAEMSIVGTGKIVGYCAYFKMLNGFEKFDYWPIEKVVAHGKRFSKSFNTGPWKDDFDKMAKKTVLKNTLSTWGMLSVEMQTAMVVDQAIIKNDTGSDVEYIDVTGADIDKEVERAQLMLADCTTIDEVNSLRGQLSKEIIDQIAGDIVDKIEMLGGANE
jgi:recombination protein RecT